MKNLFFGLVVALATFGAQAANTVIRYDWNGVPLTLNIDSNHVIAIEGLGVPGLTLLYNQQTSTLFAHLVGQDAVSTIPFDTYGYYLPEGKLLAGGDWEEFLGEPSRFWQITLPVAGQVKTCAHLFANKKAAAQAGMDITDLTRLQASLAYLIGPPSKEDVSSADACPPYQIPPAHGTVVGLPLHIINGSGKGTVELISIEADPNGVQHSLPVPATAPLGAAAHVAFLKSVLPVGMRSAFEVSNEHIPLQQQIRALKQLLRQIQEQTQAPANATTG